MIHKNMEIGKRIRFALQGIHRAWVKESSLRFQVMAAVLLLVFCLIVRPSALWCALFAINVSLVIGLELINSALEALLDRLHPEVHPEIGFVKDCLAGAVLVVSLGSVFVFTLFAASTWLV